MFLDKHHEKIREVVRKFADNEITPIAGEFDEREEFPSDLMAQIRELGLMNLNIPEEYGGPGLDDLGATIAAEELARGCVGVATSACGNALASYAIVMGASADLKKKFLTRLTDGGEYAAFALTEPNAGSDAASISTIARKVGAEYVINGTKRFITNAAISNFLTVFASTDRSKGAKGLSCFLVDRDTPGLKIGKKERKMGIRCSPTSEVIFEDVRVPASQLVGREGDGFYLAMQTLNLSRPAVGAMGVGVAQAALEAALRYAQERKQFGKTLVNMQAIQMILADMAMDVAAARLMVYNAAYRKSKKLSFTMESAMSKCYASDVAMRVTTNAVQVFGGYGYIREYPVEKYMRDAKILQIYEGTNQIQRIVTTKELVKKGV